MKSAQERRTSTRWPVTVLVTCTVSEKDKTYMAEMWARDVTEHGMRLQTVPGIKPIAMRKPKSEKARRGDDLNFERGLKITVQDLFYGDEGSPMLKGKVSWVKKLGDKGWSVGVQFTDHSKRTREIIRTFQDFINIIRSSHHKLPPRKKTARR